MSLPQGVSLEAAALQTVGETVARLGEAPLWDAARGWLFWEDGINRTVYARDMAAGRERSWSVPQEIGCMAMAADGNLVLALEDGFYRLDLASGAARRLASVQHPGPRMRLNDGKADRQGRLVAGSMVIGRRDPDAVLYRLEPGGRVAELQRGIAVTNGVCFSPDGRMLYYADTFGYALYAADYDIAGGAVGERRRIVDTRAFDARPDGATVDAEGFIWLTLVDKGLLGRFAPDGRLDRMLDLGVPFVTCPAFGGPDMDVMYLTSISHTHTMRSAHPLAGRLFELRGLGVNGIAETPVQV